MAASRSTKSKKIHGNSEKCEIQMIKDRLRKNLMELMQIPGLSGYEDRVRQRLTQKLDRLKIKTTVDRLGNLSANFPGIGPSIMVFTHMDQLGFVVRKIEPDGFLRVERVGGIPERADGGAVLRQGETAVIKPAAVRAIETSTSTLPL